MEGPHDVEIDRSGPVFIFYSGKYLEAPATCLQWFRNNPQESD